MPTTDSSAASVRSALRCWTMRESGVTRRAKRHVSSAISGIVRPGVERQPRVHAEQHDRDADDHHHARDDLHDAPADEVADRVEVVGRAREHLPGRVAVVERARVGEVRVVERRAQAVLDHDADARGDGAPRRVGRRSAGMRRRGSARRRARARSDPSRRSSCRSRAAPARGSRCRSAVVASAHSRPTPTRRRSTHHSRVRCRAVGPKLRSGGSTVLTGAVTAIPRRVPFGTRRACHLGRVLRRASGGRARARRSTRRAPRAP